VWTVTGRRDVMLDAILRWCADAPASARLEPKFECFLDALGLEAEARGMWSGGSGAVLVMRKKYEKSFIMLFERTLR
jgi:hypothetical protein